MKVLRSNYWPWSNPFDWQETGITFEDEDGEDEDDNFDEGESIVTPIAGKLKKQKEENDGFKVD